MRVPIYRYEKKELNEDCALYIVIKKKLLKRWKKSSTPPLHCLAHSLNPRFALYICLSFDNLKFSTLKGLLILCCHAKRYYSPNWVGAARGRVTPLDDNENFQMRNKCL